MRRRRPGIRRASRMRASTLVPLFKIGGLVVLGIGIVLVVIFVVVPLFGGSAGTDETLAEATPEPTATPIARPDMTELGKELSAIVHKSINDPYVFGSEISFTTGNQLQSSPVIESVAVYDINTEQTTIIEGINKNYAFLFEPKHNDDYIIYLDCKEEYGGAVCAYDRNTGEKFVMREYLFGKPKVSLSGDYALWLQQTGRGTDRLYLYQLSTRESVEIEVFVNTKFAVSAPYMSDTAIVYVQPEGESALLDGSRDTDVAEICVIPLREGGDAQRILFRPGTYVYDPMIEGSNIVFLNSNRDHNSSLMLSTREGEGFSVPTVIADRVLNYYLGDGFVAYTKDEAVYIYYFKDGSTGRISPETSRALLSSANGKSIVWYDTTELGIANVVYHAQVP